MTAADVPATTGDGLTVGRTTYEERMGLTTAEPGPRDLETLVTLLELAALELTPTKGAAFTRAELIDRAKEVGCFAAGEAPYIDHDLAIVLDGAHFVRRMKGGTLCLR